jgi:hypothetical protein
MLTRNIFLFSILTLLPAMAFSEVSLGSSLLSSVKDVAKSNDPVEAGISKVENIILNTANTQANKLEETLVDGNWMFLNLNIGRESDKTFGEVMSVYRFKETKNWGIFNQTSIINNGGRSTANVGFGARHINDKETVIFGFNTFFDQELAVDNSRASIGTELLTSVAQFRANYYKGLSNTVLYKGVNETAMDGYDYKFSYELPFLYSSDIYFKGSHWEDGASYNSDSDEFGLTAEVSPNISLRVASIKTDTKNSDTTGSLSYSIPLGGAKKKIKKLRKLKFTTTLEPIRDQLFKPVQRENRIKKKKVGQVTVSGF